MIFLEVYEQEAARAKLQYLVLSGLHAYFAHKVHSTPLHSTLLHCSLSFPSSSPNPPIQADEYGVYFFDPRYYEGTEPFHAALRLACPNQVLSVLCSSLPSSLLIPLLLHLLRRCGAPWCRATSTPRG